MTTDKRRGFTLMELLLVVAIIGLLIALIIQTGGPIRDAARRAQCQSNLKMLRESYLSYATDNNGNFPPYWHWSEWKGNDMYATWLPISVNDYIVDAPSGGQRRYDVGWGPLVFNQYITSSDIFVCPALRDSDDPWWHEYPKPTGERVYYHDPSTNWDPMTSYQEWMKNNRTLRRYTRASYCLRPGLYPRSRQWLMDHDINAFIADNFQYHYPDLNDAPYDVIRQRHVTGVNVAYLDGSVEFREDPILFTGNYDGAYQSLGMESSGDITATKMWAMWESFDRKQ